jgi:hypothetical protein
MTTPTAAMAATTTAATATATTATAVYKCAQPIPPLALPAAVTECIYIFFILLNFLSIVFTLMTRLYIY